MFIRALDIVSLVGSVFSWRLLVGTFVCIVCS